jgi:hypothetical protein
MCVVGGAVGHVTAEDPRHPAPFIRHDQPDTDTEVPEPADLELDEIPESLLHYQSFARGNLEAHRESAAFLSAEVDGHAVGVNLCRNQMPDLRITTSRFHGLGPRLGRGAACLGYADERT